MAWYFIGVYIINRTLHGHLEIRNFSCVENIFHLFATLTREIFFNPRREIPYLRAAIISSIHLLFRLHLCINLFNHGLTGWLTNTLKIG